MYLKEIKANGFKSFADKITIALDDKTTCIVGPNGSGKSNIVDAVRWVLGEQSVKNLRGDGSMSDVIFQGSKSRSPLNTAYVELVFQNDDHYLNVPYTEVSIKRKVYRTGENEYFINNERCRLKDIIDLLLDSGVGKSSFNIIGQGEVQRILSNQSEDRRQIFEEAAGILKYKKRKEEALKKLDKTHDSMERVEDIISELEVQVEPLRRQSEAARSYQENKEKLANLEIALIAYDLTNLQESLTQKETQQAALEKEIALIEAENMTHESVTSKEKTTLVKLEKDLTFFQNELLKTTEEVTRLKGELNLLQASEVSSLEEEKMKEKLRSSIEEKQELEKQIRLLKTELEAFHARQGELQSEQNTKENELKTMKSAYRSKEVELDRLEKGLIHSQYKLDALRQELEQGGMLPEAVRSILTTSTLRGICDTIGNLVTIDEKYLKAFDVASASSRNFIVVEDEQAGKEAISYLKNHHKGRATFFPISIIQSRYIDMATKEKLKRSSHFISVLSDLLQYDAKYKKIMENQYGTVLVSPTLDDALLLAKEINHRYKVVTLDGDVINAGGSMSGGATLKGKSILSMRQEVKHLEKQREDEKEEKMRLEKELAVTKEKVQATSEKLSNILFQKEQHLSLLLQKEKDLSKNEEALSLKNASISSYQSHMEGTLGEEERRLLDAYALKNTYKEELQLKIENTKEAIASCQDRILEKEAGEKVNLQLQREKEQHVQKLLLEINKASMKMDNLLATLNEEYSMTYERAKKEYPLPMEEEDARRNVLLYKEIIKKLGMVNLASIEEYERVKTRYDFLMSQKEDLGKAEATLLEIMNEMDEVMKEEFLKTFEAIREEFGKVFKELFHGGNADLKLTDEENLLTTGIDILACPPGKKLSTITLLSGGEKTLTAISLLFAILNVRSLPFCLFDEVEAALDEANVEQFGKYLAHYKSKTQFLIITHKKKTMEYADTLYGITMQESGVSKLVSVKLNNQEEVL